MIMNVTLVAIDSSCFNRFQPIRKEAQTQAIDRDGRGGDV